MKFIRVFVIPILATLVVASGVATSGQTFTRKPPANRTTSAVEKRKVKETKEAKAREEKEEGAESEAEAEQPVERTIAADANVAVKVCVASGSITVHGWDRKEVRARSSDVAEIEFQHQGEPATKIQLLIADKAQGPDRRTSCLSFSDVELEVPRGATVQLQTRDGDISVVDVATAYVSTQNGDVSIERASKAIDAGTIGGLITLKDSSGWVNLHTVGGNIDASGIRPGEPSDIFDASSVGGDITLEQVAHARLNARSLNGSLNLTGQLARDGHYGFKTISGDVTLTLPANSSFKISAKLSKSAEIITDFPITLMSYTTAPVSPALKVSPAPSPALAPAPTVVAKPSGVPSPAPSTPPPTAAPPVEPKTRVSDAEPPDDPPKGIGKIKEPKIRKVIVEGFYPMRRLDGICGSGDAFIDVGSFSGTVHLKKQ